MTKPPDSWGGHRVYFSGNDDKHEQGVGFLVHKNTVKSIIGCRPISSRFMTVRLRASPFNITIIQVYAPTSSYDDSEVDEWSLVSSWSNTKAWHSGCTRWVERRSWRSCTRRLERSLRTFLQSRDQRQRAQASRLRNPAGDSERSKKERETEEEMGRLHQGMDRNGVWRFPEGSGRQGNDGKVLLQRHP